jgi:ribonuclease Z
MTRFEITILGCGSAMPTTLHNPTSQLVNLNEKLFMIDCGEGTQLQLRRYKARLNKLHSIFISHLHGDHLFGLPGLLATLALLGRTGDLHIYAHKEVELFLNPLLLLEPKAVSGNPVFQWKRENTDCVVFENQLMVKGIQVDNDDLVRELIPEILQERIEKQLYLLMGIDMEVSCSSQQSQCSQ